jgi:hypothetical protein
MFILLNTLHETCDMCNSFVLNLGNVKPVKASEVADNFNLLLANTVQKGGVRGRVVNVVDFKQLAPHRCGFESRQGLCILSCEEAIKLAYGTSVVLIRCSFVPE